MEILTVYSPGIVTIIPISHAVYATSHLMVDVGSNIEKFSALECLLSLLSCTIWLAYDILNKESAVLIVTKTLLIVIEVFQLMITIVGLNHDEKVRTGILFFLCNVAVPAAMTIPCTLLPESKVGFIGTFALLISLTLFYWPVQYIKKLRKRQLSSDAEPFSVSHSIISLANATLWTLFACLKRDFFIGVPNAVGILIAIAELIFTTNYPQTEEEEPLLK